MAASHAKKIALVTGCSAGGLGYHTCISLLNLGWTVYATVRSEGKAGDLSFRGAQILTCDVTQEDDVRRSMAQIESEAGRLDLLVNNAGYGSMEVLAEVDIEGAAKEYETNVFGLLRVTKAAVPLMVKTPGGTVANVGSVVGFHPSALQGIYSSTKAAVHSLTHTLRCELKCLGLNVVLVAPGVVKSAFIPNELKLASPTNPDSIYSGIDAAFSHCLQARSGGVPGQPFCDKMVAAITRSHPPAEWSDGEGAWTFALLRRLPYWMVDTVATKTGAFLLAPAQPKAT